MSRIVIAGLVLALLALATAMLWQNQRYLHARRERVRDLQPLLHGGEVFHVVVFLELAEETELLPAVREMRDALAAGGGQVVYAGKVALNARPSAQLAKAFGTVVDWDAILGARAAVVVNLTLPILHRL